MQKFGLIPYRASGLPGIDITGEIDRVENILSLHYAVRGEVENMLLPVIAAPSRKDDLWKATCFEFFVAIQDQPRYWEFNMSPSGEWNVYIMDTYRRINFREESAISLVPFDFKKDNSGYSLNVSADLSPIINPGQNIQIGITAIIQTKDRNETYWALAHPGIQADFHLREGFIIEV